jgi:hypothetical protein
MAAGDTLAAWGPVAAIPPASGYATIDVRNARAVLDFDAAADEAAMFEGVYPAHYGGGDLRIELWWAATSATSGNVKWLASIENTSGIDIDSDSFGSTSSETAATAGTAGVLTQTSLAISATSAGNPQAGDAFRIKIARDAADAADTMTGDAELVAVHLYEA